MVRYIVKPEFLNDIAARRDEAPVVAELREVGSFRFFE
jgi:hypothetical protein